MESTLQEEIFSYRSKFLPATVDQMRREANISMSRVTSLVAVSIPLNYQLQYDATFKSLYVKKNTE